MRIRLPEETVYKVYVNDTLVKEYRYWIQAVTYCIARGYVYTGNGTDEWNFRYSVTSLDPRVKIIKEEENDSKSDDR